MVERKLMIVNKKFIAQLLKKNIQSNYESFLKDTNAKWLEEKYGKAYELSSILSYVILYSKPIQRIAFIGELKNEAGLEGNLEEVYFAYNIAPTFPLKVGRTKVGCVSYPSFENVSISETTYEEAKEKAIEYLDRNKENDALIISCRDVGRRIGTLGGKVNIIYKELFSKKK